MGATPSTSAGVYRRFHVDPLAGTVTDESTKQLTGPLMRPLLPALNAVLKRLSPVAKLDTNGDPEYTFRYELPPMAITALLVDAMHARGVAPAANFPYSLRAVGLVDAGAILRHDRKGLVTDNFVIVP